MDYTLTFAEFDTGRGFVVVRTEDGQRLQWATLPRTDGLESLEVVGEQYHALALGDQSFAPGRRLKLIRQPQNQFDPNAIAVFNDDETLQVGYVGREQAKRLAKRIDKGQKYEVFSMWEILEDGRRVQLRILLVKPNTSLDLSQVPTLAHIPRAGSKG